MYINGSDVLFAVDGLPVGACSEHTVSYDTETKNRAVKAPMTQGTDISVFQETDVTGLKVTVSFKGFRRDPEDERAFDWFRAAWMERKPVEGKCFRRPATGVSGSTIPDPYLVGNFVITKLTESNPAGDDSTYDGEMVMTGAPTTFVKPVDFTPSRTPQPITPPPLAYDPENPEG